MIYLLWDVDLITLANIDDIAEINQFDLLNFCAAAVELLALRGFRPTLPSQEIAPRPQEEWV